MHFVRLPSGSELWLIVGYDEAFAALNEPTLSKNWLRAGASSASTEQGSR
ncbi:hypothetical protein [Streptomyces sp. NPDC002588]